MLEAAKYVHSRVNNSIKLIALRADSMPASGGIWS
jgi:hypothetical protein